jgi:hypothetical protein
MRKEHIRFSRKNSIENLSASGGLSSRHVDIDKAAWTSDMY